jgi:hypothetical protein
MTLIRLSLLLTLAMTGCLPGSHREPPRIVEPVLSKTIGRHELVDYLNKQNHGLSSWRCMNTKVHVSMPGLPLPQKLSGSLACSAPSQFRLLSDNMIAHADFGSNEDICWAYIQPGESMVLTWKHEDSHLLQGLQGGLPRLEPDWLMLVLGVHPLDADRYELQNGPSGSREVWLVAVENSPDGTSLRRVVKVDTVLGIAREHALYDSNGQALLRAQLSNHKSCGGYRLPHTVKIQFPQCATELTLNFTGIETDCQIADALWHPPRGKNIEVVDLGDVMRARMQRDPEFLRHQPLTPRPFPDSPTAELPGKSLPDGIPVAETENKQSLFERQISYSKPDNGGRYFNTDPKEIGPDWNDDPRSLSAPESLPSEGVMPLPRTGALAAPDFDVVAPRNRAPRRRSWLPFSK